MAPPRHFAAERQWNSPYINRFLSADTIVPGYANPQSLNRYSYVLNNPLRYSDPSGHKPCEEYAGTCLSENQVTQIWNHPQNHNSKDDDNKNDGGGDKPLPSLDPTPADENTNNYYSLPYSFSSGVGAAFFSIPLLPPSPFACQWVDCALSAASLVFSGLTMTEIPQIAVPAFIADVVVTGVALVHTYDDYQQGEIGVPTALALGITGVVGLAPGPAGFGFSAINTIVTIFGFPYP